MRGRFISLEGGEGVGKSTQLKRLADALRERGVDVLETREPGGSPGAEAIRKLLLEGDVERWSALEEAQLFAAARSNHVRQVIRPALDHGQWVLCDRFIDSTLAYQGGAGGVAEGDIMTLHRIGSKGLMPDRTLLLEMPMFDAYFRAAARDGENQDRFGRKLGSYHDRVVASLKSLAEASPERFRIVAADGKIEEVTERLLAAVEDLIPAWKGGARGE